MIGSRPRGLRVAWSVLPGRLSACTFTARRYELRWADVPVSLEERRLSSGRDGLHDLLRDVCLSAESGVEEDGF